MIPRNSLEHQTHMINWVRSLLMIFYAPTRGMREMRDRSLAPVAFIALASQVAYDLSQKGLRAQASELFLSFRMV